MSKAIVMAGKRLCCNCKEQLPNDQFYQYKYKHGIRFDSRCKPCKSVLRKERYAKNRDKELRQMRKWGANHDRSHRQQDPRHRANKAKAERLRKARKRSGGANTYEIKALYAEAMRLQELTGIQFHVDHIIPLCKGGKHIMENLQILTAHENLKKGGNCPAGDSYE